jgi:hypothetical protein
VGRPKTIVTITRCEVDLDLPVGSVLQHREGGRWIRVGSIRSAVGLDFLFVKEVEPWQRLSPGVPETWRCGTTAMLLTEFPEAKRHVRPAKPGGALLLAQERLLRPRAPRTDPVDRNGAG